MSTPLPPEVLDPARLAALASYDILDTPGEPGFDDFVHLACQLCDVPVALVSLVANDRQWFKARVGFPPCETDLNSSVCAHALATPDQLLIIADLTRDQRTSGNPLVTGEPFIRFYAGAPLVTAEGYALGSLCVIDKVPRPDGLTEPQQSSLRALARQVVTQLELRRSVNIRDALRAKEASAYRAREALRDTQASVLAAGDDQETMLREVVLGAIKAIPAAQGGVIELFEGDELVYHAAQGTLRQHGSVRVPLHGSLAGRCALTQTPILLADAWTDTFVEKLTAERVQLRSAVLAPILRGSDALGVLKLQNSEPSAFISDDLEQARLFASVATAGMVQIAELRTRTAALSAKSEAETRRSALTQIGDKLQDLTSVPDMTRAASEIVGRTLGATRAGFGRIDAEVEFIDIEPDWTVPGMSSISGRHRFEDYGDIRHDLLRGQALVIEDVTTDPRTRENSGPMQAVNIAALVNMPVRERGRTVAVFIVHDDKPRSWSPEALAFLRNVADRLEAGVARIRAEERQSVLNHELSHRLKNTLAIVQSIAAQTLRDVTERDMVEGFERRVLALARAHDLLLQKSWSAARMRAVMESVLALQTDLDRFAFDGPDMDITPEAALSLSLLLHELATNALKYGALSATGGKIIVKWRAEEDGTASLVLGWTEEGGPRVTGSPSRKGFGSKLIRMGLLGTRVADLRYEPDGLRAEFRAPLSDMQPRSL